MSNTRDCPCCSGLPYSNCCAPYHRGDQEAPTPEALMRSRYCAYSKKLAPYLHRTMAANHEDRKRPDAEVLREIRDATSALRFMQLAILDKQDANEEGIARVLFYARVFEKGQNRSFIELSDFIHDGVGWRYLRGKQLAAARITNPEQVNIPTFNEVIRSIQSNSSPRNSTTTPARN